MKSFDISRFARCKSSGTGLDGSFFLKYSATRSSTGCTSRG